MQIVQITNPQSFEEWRRHARALLSAGVKPDKVLWRINGETKTDLFSAIENQEPIPPIAHAQQNIRTPRAFPDLAETALCHSDPNRFALLYRILVRLQSERELLSIMTDPDIAGLRAMTKAVFRDYHRMIGFVRFREVPVDEFSLERRRFVAWFEPDHYIVAYAAPFFCRRFSDTNWAILTPKGSATFVDEELFISNEPAEKPDISDATDDLWHTYYANIFNPARLKIKTMQTQMPKKYWANLPEAHLIPDMIANAQARVDAMASQTRRSPAETDEEA